MIENNTARASSDSPGARGGGLYTNGETTVENSMIRGNQVESDDGFAFGGGVYANAADIALEDTAVRGNTAKTTASGLAAQGGGIRLAGGTSHLRGVEISDNDVDETGEGAGGGGIEVSSGALTLVNTTISGNRVLKREGGAHFRAAV